MGFPSDGIGWAEVQTGESSCRGDRKKQKWDLEDKEESFRG